MPNLPLANPNRKFQETVGPVTSNSIDASELSNAPTFNLPTYTPPLSPNITPPPQPTMPDFGVDAAKSAVNTNLSDLGNIENELGQKSAQNNALTEQYVTPINKDLQELYAKDAQYQADLSNIASQQLQANNTSEDRLAPMFEINGEQAQIARQAQNAQQNVNIQRATNAALISAKQGQLSLAQDYVNRALAAEFDPLQSKVDYLKTVLDVNRDTLSKAEQAQIQTQINAQQAQIDQQKTDRQSIYSIMSTAAQNGADNATLDKIQQAQTPEEAISAAGQFMSDPIAKAQAQANLRLTNANIQKALSETAQNAAAAGNEVTATTADDLTGLLSNAKISATTKTNLGNLLGVINSAETLAKNNPDGKFAGISPLNSFLDAKVPFIGLGLPFRNALRSPAGVRNTGMLDAINLRIQQWASGASLTQQQIEQVNKLVPNASDTDNVVKTKLNNLVNTMNDYIKGSLASEGIEYNPAPVDLFAQQQSLADIFNQ